MDRDREGDDREKQGKSPAPFRRRFHADRWRVGNSLVKAKYQRGMGIVDLGHGSCDWNADRLDVDRVDLNEKLPAAGKRESRGRKGPVGNAVQTGLPEGSADIVAAFDLLEHMEVPHPAIREMRRVLKDGGYAVVSAPYDSRPGLRRPLFFMRDLLRGYVFGDSHYRRRCGHIRRFSPGSLAALFTEAGFTVELVFDIRRITIFLIAQKGGFQPQSLSCPDVTIVLPTLNEGKSLDRTLDALTRHCVGARIIVADDGSVDATREIASGFADRDVLFLDRSGEAVHGLTASVLDAMGRAETDYVVVLDADGQHPPYKVAEVVNLLRLGSNLVVGSRADVEKEWPLMRRLLSYAGTALGKLSLIARGKPALGYDILSGFFGLRRAFFEALMRDSAGTEAFRPRGYKVLFDLLKLLPRHERIEEMYYRFETRERGKSKLNAGIYREYLKSVFAP